MQAKNYGKVAVLMGGNTTEREVSFMSGNAILASLIKSGVDAFAFDPAEEPLENLKKYNCERAFIIIHGKNGEDGKLQGALEYLKIPYTGSGVMASAIGMDKYRTKLIWQSLGIPVAKSQYVNKASYNADTFKLEIELPVIVKPADDGSSLGFSKFFNVSELNQAIAVGFAKSNKILIEQMIIGDEFTITMIDGKIYPLIKIEAPQGEYDFEHKYYSDETRYLCNYNLGAMQYKIEEWALAGYHGIGAVGVARSDFMIDKNGQVYFLEINTVPGMTGHSLVPQSVAVVGIDFDQLCLLILDGAALAK
jgi:D-alanine-D-alanine ligase